jgi:hypothetical protein
VVKIVGPEEVNKMVHAHAQEGTKICHMYLVSRYEDGDPDVILVPRDKYLLNTTIHQALITNVITSHRTPMKALLPYHTHPTLQVH